MLKNEFQTQCETGIICNVYPTCDVCPYNISRNKTIKRFVDVNDKGISKANEIP